MKREESGGRKLPWLPFVGSQVPLAVGEDTFYLDLLFYHLRLYAYIVIELKTGNFMPECAESLTPTSRPRG